MKICVIYTYHWLFRIESLQIQQGLWPLSSAVVYKIIFGGSVFVRLRGDGQYYIHEFKSLEYWNGSKVDQLIFISPAIQGCKVFVS